MKNQNMPDTNREGRKNIWKIIITEKVLSDDLLMLKNLEISKVKHVKIICRCRYFEKASSIYFEIGRTWKLSTQKSKIKIFFRFLKIFETWIASKTRKSILKTKKNS